MKVKSSKKVFFGIVAAIALGACETAGIEEFMAKATKPVLNTSEPRPVPTQASLKHKSATELNELLGDPDLKRRDAGVEVWQYAEQTCVLLAYLYPGNGNELALEHLEVRSPREGGEMPSYEDCMREALITQESYVDS